MTQNLQRKHIPLWISFLISFGVHLGVFFFLIQNASIKFWQDEKKNQIKPIKYLNVMPFKKNQKRLKIAGNQSSLRRLFDLKKSQSRFQTLGVDYDFFRKKIDNQLKIDKSSETMDMHGESWKSGLSKSWLDYSIEVKKEKVYRIIFEKLNQYLSYPIELRQNQITGKVFLKLTFSRSGRLLSEKTQLNSNSNFLRVHVARLIRRAFAQPLQDLIETDSSIVVQCVFTFERIRYQDESVLYSRQWSMGNELYFYRYFQQSALEWRAGPLQGLGPSVGVDLSSFIEKIGQNFSKKVKIDPLQSYREDPDW